MPLSVCVTGGAGFIGSHIVEALVERKYEVRVVDNLSTGTIDNLQSVWPSIRFLEGDIEDADFIQTALAGVDVVFHQAALASVPLSVERPRDVHHACATGTLAVLDAARRNGVRRVIYAASSSCYGDSQSHPRHEKELPVVLSPYAASKLAGELYCRAFYHSYGLETVCLRYFNVFGPRQDPASPYSAVIPIFITRLLRGDPPIIFGDGTQSRDFVFIADVVQANLSAMQSEYADGRAYNVACGQSTSLLELLKQLQQLLQVDVQPRFDPPRPGDVPFSLADISRARDELEYQPSYDLITGLAESIEYYRRLAESSMSQLV